MRQRRSVCGSEASSLPLHSAYGALAALLISDLQLSESGVSCAASTGRRSNEQRHAEPSRPQRSLQLVVAESCEGSRLPATVRQASLCASTACLAAAFR